MAKRILVAVDHEPPAELLDLINDAAHGGGATVRLVHVASTPDNVIGKDGYVIAFADQEVARLEAEGHDMLRTIELRLGGVRVESVVRFGDPADQIVREAEDFDADLIAIPTHARSGVARLLFGSVAEQVARRAPMAVALIRPRSTR